MIITERLIIRPFTLESRDMGSLFSILSDEKTNTYLPWFMPTTMEETINFYTHQISDRKVKSIKGFFLSVCLKENNLPIGYLSLSSDKSHDFGYGLKSCFWNQGIMTEAVTAVVDWLSTQNIDFITATHDRNNIFSGKLMEKVGMKYQYSYEEQWQPKNISVVFRMYQLNFKDDVPVYAKYKNKSTNSFVEEI